jgi:hypothetical protein
VRYSAGTFCFVIGQQDSHALGLLPIMRSGDASAMPDQVRERFEKIG